MYTKIRTLSILNNVHVNVQRLSRLPGHSTIVREIAQGEPENTCETKLQHTIYM